MATIKQLGRISRLLDDVLEGVYCNQLNAGAVEQALRALLGGTLELPTPPSWWRTPEQQLRRARQLWPDRALPNPPEEFTPNAPGEVLLLHVPGTFDSLWDKVPIPEGYTKHVGDEFRADPTNLRLMPHRSEYTDPLWLAFDPEHAKGYRPNQLWQRFVDAEKEVAMGLTVIRGVDVPHDLAAGEVLSALIQFPEWPIAWRNSSAPNLSGYQVAHNGDWGFTLQLRFDRGEERLRLRRTPAAAAREGWASPSVREC